MIELIIQGQTYAFSPNEVYYHIWNDHGKERHMLIWADKREWCYTSLNRDGDIYDGIVRETGDSLEEFITDDFVYIGPNYSERIFPKCHCSNPILDPEDYLCQECREDS